MRQRLGNALKNRPVVALALLLAAVILPFCLLHFDQYTLTFPQDDAVRAPEPILLLERDAISNEFGLCGPAAQTCGVEHVEGYFGRSFVPPGVALLGGLVLPQMLVLACFAYTAGRRWASMLALCLAALLLVFDLVHSGAAYVATQSAAVTQTGPAAQPPWIETGREPHCGTDACDAGRAEIRFGYFLDDRLPFWIAVLLAAGVPAALALAALGLGIDGARRHWMERRHPILAVTPMR